MVTPKQAIDTLRAAYQPPPGYRSAHAKGVFYAGTFAAAREAAALCRAAHLSGAEVPVLVRWSNGSGTPSWPDGKPDIRGMAIRFRTSAGDTDLLAQTSPRFPTDDPGVFVKMAQPSVHQWKMPFFMARHPATIAPLVAGMRGGALPKPASYAEIPYYPIHAYGWRNAAGDLTWVRYQLRPVGTLADRLPETYSGTDRLRDEMAARLERGPVAFDLHVQVAGDGDDPHSATSVWKNDRDFIAGRISVTELAKDPEQGNDVVVFDPTRIIDGIELSNDPILRFRPLAYAESVKLRQRVV
ncbi:MAG TPA: catalase [Jatrophihabitantaceae bacterium]|jgi:catalase|nr:catalase [Jatrophihabitantaceae bacterium]